MTQDQRIGAPSGRRGGAGRAPGRSAGGVLQGVLIAIGLIAMLGSFALLAVQYRPYTVPTDSMEPTIPAGTTVLAHTVKSSDPASVGRGDVVVFQDATWGDMAEVKRVAGVGGDTVACCDKQGRVTVDGKPIDEPYLKTSAAKGGMLMGPATTTFSAKVPTGRLFLLGDNRPVSMDSRSHLTEMSGTVPVSDVKGRVEGAVWPWSRMGVIDRTAAFDALPGQDATAHGPLGLYAYTCVAGGALVLVTAALGSLAGMLRRGRSGRG